MYLFLLFGSCCFAQDVIYFKDKSTQQAKILEVNIDKVRYKKSEILNGPTYEVLKNEVTKIQYSNGFVDYFVSKPDTLNKIPVEKPKRHDTTGYSTIYILFNYGNDESQKFPIYFNDRYICTLKNHSRLKYVIHSSGKLIVERRGVNSYKMGPKTKLYIEQGMNYGINIMEPYPWGLDPNKRFTMEVFVDSAEASEFIKYKFNGFKPFKANDIYMLEDVKHPIMVE